MQNQKLNFQNLCLFINAPVIIFWRMRVSLEIYLFHWANSINRFLLNEIWRLKVVKRFLCNVKHQDRFSSMNGSICRSLVIWFMPCGVLFSIMAMIADRWSARRVAEACGGGGQVRGLAARRRWSTTRHINDIRCRGIFTKKVSVCSL